MILFLIINIIPLLILLGILYDYDYDYDYAIAREYKEILIYKLSVLLLLFPLLSSR